MSKKKVLAQGIHTLFDGNGSPMSPGEIYTVSDCEVIENYISEGFLTIVAPVDFDQQEENKKSQLNKNAKVQVTEPLTPQENSNG
jgi:hypothetical protein